MTIQVRTPQGTNISPKNGILKMIFRTSPGGICIHPLEGTPNSSIHHPKLWCFMFEKSASTGSHQDKHNLDVTMKNYKLYQHTSDIIYTSYSAKYITSSLLPLKLPSREWIHIPPGEVRKIIFKIPFLGDMLVPWGVHPLP